MTERHAPDLEDLAAFVDGRLSGERKAQVEERLLRDEDYYQVFLDTVSYRREAGREEVRREAPAPVPIARRRPWRIAAPLAAAAVLAVAVGVALLRPAADLAALIDAGAVAGVEGWSDPGWRRTRSGGPSRSAYDGDQLAFRLGARTVDLRVALAAGDRPEARAMAAQAEDLAAAAELLPLAGLYLELRQRLDQGEPRELAGLAREAEELLAGSFDGAGERRLALGRWAEVGRLAALSRDAGALRRVLRRDPGSRSVAEIGPQAERLEALVEGPEPDLAAVGVAFEEILRALAGPG